MNIKIENLTKNYCNRNVLSNLSLELRDKTSIGIIGSSGCGKSTLLRLLAGIEPPEKGTILINDKSPILQKREFQAEIGVVFQQHHLFPHLTLEKNITLILEKTKKMEKTEAKVRAEEILTELFMEEHKDKRPGQLSGGQAQRGSIARALATNPKLIFLDEPTAALDPQLTFEVLQSVERLKTKGIDFVFVTHELRFLRNFADYFLYLDQGQIIEQGEISALEHPQNQQFAEFLQPHLS
ncbi:MAG: ATP-binding cassette domain-containing protein [Eubacteriales bacterium]